MIERFTEALHTLDADGDPKPLVALADDDAQLTKLDERNEVRGQEGARQFWQDYRNVFQDITTTFTHTVTGDRSVALEWASEGTLRNGTPFGYRGVTIIEGDDQRLRSVRTYYDSAAFLADASNR